MLKTDFETLDIMHRFRSAAYRRRTPMEIYDGDIKDNYDRECHSYLQVNSCGFYMPSQRQMITYRRKKRVDYHIIYIAEGHCKVEYEGKTWLLNQGFVLYPPNIPQTYVDYEDSRRIWLHFTGYNIEEILKDARLSCGVHPIAPSLIVEKMLIQLVAEHNQKLDISNEKGLLLSILYTLGKLANNMNSTNERINEAVTFITTHYNPEINIKELADSCNLSQSRFMYLFKEKTGLAPHAYQQTLRINNSKTLLSSTQLSISDICRLSGYQDPLYFSRIFRKYVGMSPREYRNRKEPGL